MANGYQPGEYFERFLSQLPQIYQMQQNVKMQEERLGIQKQTALDNQAYRSQLIEQNKATQEYNEFKQLWTSTEGKPDVQQMLLEQHPYVKSHPEMISALREGHEISESMKGHFFAK